MVSSVAIASLSLRSATCQLARGSCAAGKRSADESAIESAWTDGPTAARSDARYVCACSVDGRSRRPTCASVGSVSPATPAATRSLYSLTVAANGLATSSACCTTTVGFCKDEGGARAGGVRRVGSAEGGPPSNDGGRAGGGGGDTRDQAAGRGGHRKKAEARTPWHARMAFV